MNPRGKRWRPSTPMAAYRDIQAEEARVASRLRREGWPVMHGTPEERERRYQRALLEDQLAGHRRNRGLV